MSCWKRPGLTAGRLVVRILYLMPTIELQDQVKIFKEGTVDLISEEDLIQKLKTKKMLRIKYGADPSAPDLHLGHTVPLRKLARLQELGHKIVFVVGDFTARIGDPSHQTETRKALSEEEVKRNAKTYQDQVFCILNRKKTEVRYNSEWLGKFKPDDFLRLASRYTVARLLERDDFAKRFKEGRPIAVLEFLYPLLQGYDSVALESDVELGGTDQKFNLLVGRELQRDWKQSPQVVITLPIIEGTDGKVKMSKSIGNHIALQDSPREMFGKIMSIPDTLTVRYFRYLTNVGLKEADEIETELASGALHPREAKASLAREIVSAYYGSAEAEKASKEFDRMFRAKELPDEMETVSVSKNEWDIVSLLNEAKLVTSKSEARRLIQQGGVKIDGTKVQDEKYRVSLSEDPVTIQCGKRKFARIRGKR